MLATFVPGQRWISNTESELGLGIVIESVGRRVAVSFPAAGERRIYASDNAPLSRVIYSIGEQISNNEGLVFIVTERIEEHSCFIYRGVDGDGNRVLVEEIDLDSFVQFSKPQDRLFAGQVDKNSNFQLRVETLNHRHRQQQSAVFGLLGPRVQLLPHQMYIASQVAKRYAPRVLLADEVGLGKTIEAGMILHQQLVTGMVDRALVVVPESLLHQWLVEMLRRFNLRFTILDDERYEALSESEPGNPFESAQLILCSLAFLTGNPDYHAQAMLAHWDMLIVDEAHHLAWSEQESSTEYACIESLAAQSHGLLLLTATPEQLGLTGHFARLRLLDPDRYHDLQPFLDEEANYQAVSDLLQLLLREDSGALLHSTPDIIIQIETYLGTAATTELHKTMAEQGDLKPVIDDIVQRLLDQHGTGRVLFRNTRDVVTGFPQRQLNTHALVMPERYRQSCADNALDNTLSLEMRLQPESVLGKQWLTEDPRVLWLTDFLAAQRQAKILLICAKASTAQELENHLRLRVGIRSAVFHEGMSLVNRDRAAAYFADLDEGAQILLCSEIGSEGRNFQFAQHLILFDLPLNPDLLEQRIGRLDRIGQQYTIQIHVPYYEYSAQQVLLRWYHEGLNALQQVCPAGPNLLQMFAEPLQQGLLDADNHVALEQLIHATQEQAAIVLQQLQQGRDRLLELNSYNASVAADVIAQITAATNSLELIDYMARVFDHFGIEQQPHSTDTIVVHPGEHMLTEHFPGLPEDGLTGTYQRNQALVREDMQYLTWEHPLVSGAMEMIASGDFGNTALCSIKLPPLKPGTLLLEAIFVVYCPAPRHLQLQRYLSQSMVRVVVAGGGRDVSAKLSIQRINDLAERVATRTAQELVRHARLQISALVDRAEAIAKAQREHILATARQNLMQQQEAELQRLLALAEVNPNIRVTEIDYQRSAIESMQQYLQGALLKLDALRVIMTT